MVLTGEDGRSYPLPQGDTPIGRGVGPGVRLNAPAVSRQHAVIRWDGTRAMIKDLGSTHGTYVNGRRLEPRRPYPLQANDVLVFGDARQRLKVQSAGASSAHGLRSQPQMRQAPRGPYKPSTILAALAGIAAVLTPIIGLANEIIKGRPPAPPTPFPVTVVSTPTENKAEFRDLTVDYSVTPAMHEAEFSGDVDAPADEIGSRVQYTIVTTGFQGRECQIVWHVYEYNSRSPVRDPRVVNISAGTYTPDVPIHTWSSAIWIPTALLTPGYNYFIRVEVLDDQNHRIGFKDTDPPMYRDPSYPVPER